MRRRGGRVDRRAAPRRDAEQRRRARPLTPAADAAGLFAGVDPRALSLLLAWVSPQLPIGAFGYSHGLERLAEAGHLADAGATLRAVRVALGAAGRCDSVLLCHAFRARAAGDRSAMGDVQELALALAPSAERREETVFQGNAFVRLADALWPDPDGPLAGDVPLPVALGAFGAAHRVPLPPLVHAQLSAFVAQLVSAAVRIVPLGQTDGQRVQWSLAADVAAVAAEAQAADLDDIGGAALGLDVASLQHEVQEVRLFRS